MSLKNFLLASLTWALLFLGTGDCLAQKDASARSAKYNGEVLRAIASMPKGGAYAVYRKELPENQRYRDLYQVVKDLNQAMDVAPDGSLSVNVTKAGSVSFCSSATYLVFGKAVQNLQKERVIESSRALSREMGLIGGSKEVIKGKLDGVGIFGHWNADGPGTAVLFRKLGLGSNFSGYEKARPGDFLKIFWNEKIGKGERGHSVVFWGPARTANRSRCGPARPATKMGPPDMAPCGWKRAGLKERCFPDWNIPKI